MRDVTEPANRYWAEVDPDAVNNADAFSLELVGSNKRVLELGPAAGAMTRALAANGCRVVGLEIDPEAAALVEPAAERVIVGDISDPAVVSAAIDDEGFDVVLGGDVLEHLSDPLGVLRACRAALKPGGYVVLSLPNIAHADVKLQLLAGRFPYRDTGLLDRTHLHFFTLESIHEMVREAGLLVVDLRRVTVAVFQTELAVDPASVPAELLERVTAAGESDTYQFVVRAVVHDGDAELERLANRVVTLADAIEGEQLARLQAERALEEARTQVVVLRDQVDALQPMLDEAVAQARGFEALSDEHAEHIDAIRSTRSYRMLAPLRAVFGRRG